MKTAIDAVNKFEGSQYDIVKCTNIQPLTVEIK